MMSPGLRPDVDRAIGRLKPYLPELDGLVDVDESGEPVGRYDTVTGRIIIGKAGIRYLDANEHELEMDVSLVHELAHHADRHAPRPESHRLQWRNALRGIARSLHEESPMFAELCGRCYNDAIDSGVSDFTNSIYRAQRLLSAEELAEAERRRSEYEAETDPCHVCARVEN